MVLSMTSSFTDMEIEDVELIRSVTVYKLIGHANESIIVKCEQTNASSDQLRHARVAMKAVSHEAGYIKPLKDSEKQALKDWVDFISRVTNSFAEDKVKDISPGIATSDLSNALQRDRLWYKMPTAKLTHIDDMMNARMSSTPDKGPLKLLLNGLKEEGGMEQIGKIAAADIYNDNGDRFSPLQGKKASYSGREFQFKSIFNPGNVFMIGKDTNQRLAFSGHDFLDCYAPNFDHATNPGEDWLGVYLCDADKRKVFAKAIISDFELLLTPNRKSYSPFKKLGGDAYKRIEKGMVAGMKEIVAAVDRRYGNAMPTGVKSRRDQFATAVAGR